VYSNGEHLTSSDLMQGHTDLLVGDF